MSFPSEKSVKFPSRHAGCLNYYDDKTHKDVPPKFREVIRLLKENGMEIIFATKSYKPFYLWLLGLLNERKSRKEDRVLKGTWAYWGFETVIWARKL